MSLLNKNNTLPDNAILARLSLLVGLGLILFLFESFIPRPLPWLKPGLAHVATLVALYTYGNRAALIVVLARIMVGSIILGTLFNPTFVLSFFGGIAATFFMMLFKQNFPSIFSIFGVSIVGAVVHNMTQLLLVELLIVHKIEILYLTPVMIISSIFTGFIVALISHLVITKIKIISYPKTI